MAATWHIIVGPPGTGKTTTLVNRFDTKIGRGVPPNKIAYVSFTKAAKQEVTRRLSSKFNLTPDDCCWVRTIHSTAYRLLGIKQDEVMGAKHWVEFAKANAFNFSQVQALDAEDIDSEVVVAPNRTVDDLVRFLYDWGRSLRLSVEQTMLSWPAYVDAWSFRRYHKEFLIYKREKGLVDFGDMLEMALVSPERPNVDVAFIDEAQDLSPIQQTLCEKWFAPCDDVFVAGDDDQAIFGFQGANPDWMLRLANDCETEILTQSYRVPIAVHAQAQSIIHRNRHHRISKQYHPTPEKGSVDHLPLMDAIRGIDGESTFVLGRSWYTLASSARELFRQRVPYLLERRIHGVPNPYSEGGCLEAMKAVLSIAFGRKVTIGALRGMLKRIPSKEVNTRRLLPHGVKALLQEMRSEKKLGITALIELGLTDLVDKIVSHNDPLSVLRGIHRDILDYCHDVIDEHGELPEPKVRLMSMHRSKGQEADKVIVIPDMSKKTYLSFVLGGLDGGFEAENRVAYVAATRAKKSCVIALPASHRYYDFPRREQCQVQLIV